VVSPFTSAKPSCIHYKTRPRALLSYTHHLGYTPHLHLYSLFHSFRSSCEQRQELQGELVSLEEEQHFGMNTMSSSKCKFSSLSYSIAYELDYSLDHVIVMIYELVYSLYAMILTFSSSFFNVHMICMSRSRVRLGWQFIVPFGLPISFTCRSIGSGT
jgi:hypothetical protein